MAHGRVTPPRKNKKQQRGSSPIPEGADEKKSSEAKRAAPIVPSGTAALSSAQTKTPDAEKARQARAREAARKKGGASGRKIDEQIASEKKANEAKKAREDAAKAASASSSSSAAVPPISGATPPPPNPALGSASGPANPAQTKPSATRNDQLSLAFAHQHVLLDATSTVLSLKKQASAESFVRKSLKTDTTKYLKKSPRDALTPEEEKIVSEKATELTSTLESPGGNELSKYTKDDIKYFLADKRATDHPNKEIDKRKLINGISALERVKNPDYNAMYRDYTNHNKTPTPLTPDAKKARDDIYEAGKEFFAIPNHPTMAELDRLATFINNSSALEKDPKIQQAQDRFEFKSQWTAALSNFSFTPDGDFKNALGTAKINPDIIEPKLKSEITTLVIKPLKQEFENIHSYLQSNPTVNPTSLISSRIDEAKKRLDNYLKSTEFFNAAAASNPNPAFSGNTDSKFTELQKAAQKQYEAEWARCEAEALKAMTKRNQELEDDFTQKAIQANVKPKLSIKISNACQAQTYLVAAETYHKLKK